MKAQRSITVDVICMAEKRKSGAQALCEYEWGEGARMRNRRQHGPTRGRETRPHNRHADGPERSESARPPARELGPNELLVFQQERDGTLREVGWDEFDFDAPGHVFVGVEGMLPKKQEP